MTPPTQNHTRDCAAAAKLKPGQKKAAPRPVEEPGGVRNGQCDIAQQVLGADRDSMHPEKGVRAYRMLCRSGGRTRHHQLQLQRAEGRPTTNFMLRLRCFQSVEPPNANNSARVAMESVRQQGE